MNFSAELFVAKNMPCSSKDGSNFGSKGIKGSKVADFVNNSVTKKSSSKLVNALWANQNDLAKSHAELLSAFVNPKNTKKQGDFRNIKISLTSFFNFNICFNHL
jgi:hypothetical protein